MAGKICGDSTGALIYLRKPRSWLSVTSPSYNTSPSGHCFVDGAGGVGVSVPGHAAQHHTPGRENAILCPEQICTRHPRTRQY